MKITVCIGSSCHLKGSQTIVEQLQRLMRERDLADRVTLGGAFCMGHCMAGVCVRIDGDLYSLKPEGVAAFFENEIIRRL